MQNKNFLINKIKIILIDYERNSEMFIVFSNKLIA